MSMIVPQPYVRRERTQPLNLPRASQDAFGAPQARALYQQGSELRRTGGRLAEMAAHDMQRQADDAAKEAFLRYQADRTSLLHNAEDGYLTRMHGEDAYKGQEAVLQRIQDAGRQHGADLSGPAREAYAAMIERDYVSQRGTVQRHGAVGRAQYEASLDAAIVEGHKQDALRAHDSAGFDESVAQAGAALAETFDRQGLPAEAFEQEAKRHIGEALIGRIEGLAAAGDIEGAEDLIERYAPKVSPDAEEAARKALRGAAYDALNAEIAEDPEKAREIIGGGGGGGSMDKLVAVTEREESGSPRYATGQIRSYKKNGDLGYAWGAMQMLDGTGKLVAKRLGIKWQPELMRKGREDPVALAYQRKLGRAYLEQLTERYGDPVLAGLAYHSGPGNVDKYIRRHGDPREGAISYMQLADKLERGGAPHGAARLRAVAKAMQGEPIDAGSASTTSDRRYLMQPEKERARLRRAAGISLSRAATAEIDAVYDAMDLSAAKGDLTAREIEEARTPSGYGLPDDKKAKLYRKLETRKAKVAGADEVRAAIEAGEHMRSLDGDDRKAVDAYTEMYLEQAAEVGREVDPAQIAAQIAVTTGVAPEELVISTRQAMYGGDPQKAAEALARSAAVMAEASAAFKGRGGGREIEIASKRYTAATELGYPAEIAISYAIRDDTDLAKDAKSAARRRFDDVDTDSNPEITREEIVGRFGSWFPFVRPELRDQRLTDLRADARRIFQIEYERSRGVEDLAKEATFKQLEEVWGVSSINGSAELMKFPPEKMYPPVNGSHDYVSEQVMEVLEDGAYAPGYDGGEWFLLPNHETARSWQSGQPVVYSLMYEDSDGQLHTVMSQPDKGGVRRAGGFYADPKAARALNPEQEKALKSEHPKPLKGRRAARHGRRR